MAAFKDSQDRDWVLSIGFGQIAELKAAGIDLEHPEDERLMRVLYTDPFALVNVLWVLVKKNAGAVTKESFLEGLDGEVLDLAADALFEAIVDFIHRRRSASVKAKLPELMAAVDKAHARTVQTALDSALKNLAGGSLESSASIPAS